MSYDFTNTYHLDPWGDITQNERPWYDPVLREWYYRNSVYSQHVNMKVEMAGAGTPNARTIYFSDIIPATPNIDPIDARKMEATRLYSDSYQRAVTTQRYGNGLSLHKESNLFSYWKRQGGGDGMGLWPLVNGQLGQIITDQLDLLARNAFLANPFPFMGLASASSFAGISNTDMLTTELVDQVRLSMRGTPKLFTALPTVDPNDNVFCITSAGTVYDLMREAVDTNGAPTFVDVKKYRGDIDLVNGEVGSWRGVRFVENALSVLYNVGTITHQTEIKAAVAPGDGSPNPATTAVEGVYYVGQPGAAHYITVQDASGFAVGDYVTIHKLRHDGTTLAALNYQGVTNGVIYTDAMAQNAEIVSIDTSGGAGAHKLVFKEPYRMTGDLGKGLETDLGSTVYGYVTLGKTIHSALFLKGGGDNGIVAGVAQPPTIYTPPAIDDFLSMQRITYDAWLKFQGWNYRQYRLAFVTGMNAINNNFWR